MIGHDRRNPNLSLAELDARETVGQQRVVFFAVVFIGLVAGFLGTVQRNFVKQDSWLRSVYPKILDRSDDIAIGRNDRHATWIGVVGFDDEIAGHAHRHDFRLSFKRQIGQVVAIGIACRTDPIAHRIARGRQGGTVPFCRGLGALNLRLRRLFVRRPARTLTVRHQVLLGLGRLREADHAYARRPVAAVGFQRIAFPLVLAAKINDQAGKENPECVEHQLCNVDVTCYSSCRHDMYSCVWVDRPSRAFDPGRTECPAPAGRFESAGPMGLTLPA